jgi:hypothetical protein
MAKQARRPNKKVKEEGEYMTNITLRTSDFMGSAWVIFPCIQQSHGKKSHQKFATASRRLSYNLLECRAL